MHILPVQHMSLCGKRRASAGTAIRRLFRSRCPRDGSDSLRDEGVGLAKTVNSFVATET